MKHALFSKIGTFFKKEIVLCLAAILSVISMFFVPPSMEYLEYMDWRVLALLFGLMLVVGGLQSIGTFRYLGLTLLKRIQNARSLSLLLVALCFFSAMLITNDVALLTFVPFAIMILNLANQTRLMIPVIVLQTIAANLGSMLTPIGNPQNLYLYSAFSIPMGTFLLDMLPLTLISMVLLVISIFLLPNAPIQVDLQEDRTAPSRPKLLLYLLLFLVAIACVLHLISWPVMLCILLVAVLFIDRKLFKSVDYFLLLTFVCFFLFIGKPLAVLKNEELRVFAGIVLGFTLLIALGIAPMYGGIGQGLRHAFFNVSAVISTTGFGTVDFVTWPEYTKWLLLGLMFCGACAGSTGGGMKVSRVIVLGKTALAELRRAARPRSVTRVQLEGQSVSAEGIHTILVFFALYIALTLGFAFLVSFDGYDITTSFTAALTCLSNVGPGMGLIGPTGNFSIFSPLSKLALSFAMLLGRLEIYPMLILLSRRTWRRG